MFSCSLARRQSSLRGSQSTCVRSTFREKKHLYSILSDLRADSLKCDGRLFHLTLGSMKGPCQRYLTLGSLFPGSSHTIISSGNDGDASDIFKTRPPKAERRTCSPSLPSVVKEEKMPQAEPAAKLKFFLTKHISRNASKYRKATISL